MPSFSIRVRNSRYLITGSHEEYADASTALAAGVFSAAAMVAEEIRLGIQAASIEVSIHNADDEMMLQSVVTLAVSPLLVA